MEKNQERKAIFYDTGNRKLNWMLDFIGTLLFLLIVVILFKGIFYFMFPPPSRPADLSILLMPYLGLPLMFWMLAGVGIMFHGFNLIDSNNRVRHYYDKRN
jgi:hypothetical protein